MGAKNIYNRKISLKKYQAKNISLAHSFSRLCTIVTTNKPVPHGIQIHQYLRTLKHVNQVYLIRYINVYVNQVLTFEVDLRCLSSSAGHDANQFSEAASSFNLLSSLLASNHSFSPKALFFGCCCPLPRPPSPSKSQKRNDDDDDLRMKWASPNPASLIGLFQGYTIVQVSKMMPKKSHHFFFQKAGGQSAGIVVEKSQQPREQSSVLRRRVFFQGTTGR